LNWAAISAIGTVVGGAATVGALMLSGFFADKCATSRADMAALGESASVTALSSLLASTPNECRTQRVAVQSRIEAEEARLEAARVEAERLETERRRTADAERKRRAAETRDLFLGTWAYSGGLFCRDFLEVRLFGDTLSLRSTKVESGTVSAWDEVQVVETDPPTLSYVAAWSAKFVIRADGSMKYVPAIDLTGECLYTKRQ